jgi:hypothetical protein
MMEAVRSSETSVNFYDTHIPEDSTLGLFSVPCFSGHMSGRDSVVFAVKG